jgi:type IV secretion system protein VirB4
MIMTALKPQVRPEKIVLAEKTASTFIPYTRHIDRTTIKTKDGYLLKIIKIDGLPFETQDQLELNQRKQIRAAMLKGMSNSRFAVYHHIIRKEVSKGLYSFFENEWCGELDRAYQKKLSTKRMFINEQYLTIVRRPAQGAIGLMAELGRTAFRKMDKNISTQQEAENHKALNEACAHILTTLSPYNPRILGVKEMDNGSFSEPLSFLSYLINLVDKPVALPRMALDQYLPCKRISFGKETFEVRGAASSDVKLGAILSLKEYTEGTGPGMLDGLLRLPHEFIITQSFGFVDRQAALNSMRDIKRKMIASEQGAISLESDMDNAIDDLASGRSSFGEHHLTVTAIGKNGAELDRVISDSMAALINLGIVAVREDLNMEPAFWARLPGNFSYIARRSLISNRNFAGFASLHTFPSGKHSRNHWGTAITRLETTSGTAYWFNFHERDVGNFTVIGPTGSGKTVLLTFLHAQAQRMAPKSVYFDKDRGAEIYLRTIGASYTVVNAGQPTGLNPLQLPDTPENQAFLRDWVKVLLDTEGNGALDAADIDVIARAVKAIYALPPEYRRLSVLVEHLGGHKIDQGNSLVSRMAMWHGSGERAWLFDNVRDSLSLDKQTIGFDLTSILDDPKSRTPWLMYIFHRINALFDGQKVIIMLDEGWKMLDDPVFAARIKDWMKTIRKQNGIVGFATQSVRDSLRSSVGDAIIEQSPTQIFLPNPRANEEDYCKGFGLSHHELTLIRELTPQSRCFLIRHGTDSVVARLDLTGLDDYIAVLSGRTETVQLMHKLIENYGDTPDQWLPHFQRMRKE